MKKKGLRRIVGLLLAAVLLCGCSTLPGTASSSRDEPKVLTVGCDTYAPFSYLDADGKPTGVDMELATEAFRRMGYEPEFRFINWEEKKDLLESGEIDCIWSSYTMDGREDEYQWAGRYMKSSQVVAVNADSDIYTLSDLAGKTIAVRSTAKPEDIFRSRDSRIPELCKVISVQKRDLIFILLSKGYVDALAAHDTSINEFSKEIGLRYRILEEPLMSVGLGVAIMDVDDFKVCNDTYGHHAGDMALETAADGLRDRPLAPERWDGHGYPDGLEGDEIPISAQLVSMADVYDALTSKRCYKKAFSHEKAVQMILNGECGVFNPLLVRCLTDTAEELKRALNNDFH